MSTRAAATEKPYGICDFFSGRSRARGYLEHVFSCLDAAWVAIPGSAPSFVLCAGKAVITG